MAGKTHKRDVYVTGVNEAGPGRVRVTVRSGDAPQKQQQRQDIMDAAVAPRRGPGGTEEDVTLIMDAEEAPSTFENLTLRLEKRA